MGRLCYLCLSNDEDEKTQHQAKRSFHKFPSNSNLREIWIKVCGLSETDDVSRIKICSLHFLKKDYKILQLNVDGQRLILKPGAVPSVGVPYPNLQLSSTVLESESETKCSVTDHEVKFPPVTDFENKFSPLPDLNEDDFKEEETCETTKRKFAEPRYVSEITISDVSTPRKAKRILSLVHRTDREKSKKIESLQRKNRTLLKRFESLKETIVSLHSRGLMSDEGGNILMSMLTQKNSENICHEINLENDNT